MLIKSAIRKKIKEKIRRKRYLKMKMRVDETLVGCNALILCLQSDPLANGAKIDDFIALNDAKKADGFLYTLRNALQQHSGCAKIMGPMAKKILEYHEYAPLDKEHVTNRRSKEWDVTKL